MKLDTAIHTFITEIHKNLMKSCKSCKSCLVFSFIYMTVLLPHHTCIRDYVAIPSAPLPSLELLKKENYKITKTPTGNVAAIVLWLFVAK